MDYMENREETIYCVTKEEIELTISEMARDKAPGIDGLTLSIIEEVNMISKDILYKIYNRCIRESYFPLAWKKARVVYFAKEGKDPTKLSSYRPICLLPVLGKILDRVITNRLVIHLESNGLLSREQYGFRRGLSTLNALQMVMNKIRQNKERKEHTCLIALDIKNAFNTIKKKSIIDELRKLNLDNYLFNMILNYLDKRKVVLRDGEINYNVGVPQGSSLGPILWLIIINSLLDVSKYENWFHLQAFADDIMIIISSKTSYKFTQLAAKVLKICEDWAKDHGMEYSIEKCSYIMVASSGEISRNPTIKLNGKNIKYTKELKYLGLLFDKNINFMKHLDMVKERGIKIMYKLTRIMKKTWGINTKIVREIYKVVIEKIILYASEVWYTNRVVVNRKLKQVQRPFLLYITKCYKTVATDALCILAGCPPLHLVAKAGKDLYEIYERGSDIEIDGFIYNKTNSVTRERRIRNIDKLLAVSWTYDSEPKTDYNFYTDGSKLDNKVGAGMILYEKNIKAVTRKDRLSDNSNSYVAELRAIQMAIEEAKKRDIKRFDIYTDSRSALQALNTLIFKDDIVDNIKETILTENLEVYFHWVKAHAGFQRNEEVDILAKEATKLDFVLTEYKWSRNKVKKKLKDCLIKNWQLDWDTSTTGRRVYEIFPKVKIDRLCGDFVLNQAITGHGCFGAYQKRFFGKDDTCSCGEEETPDHCIYSCRNFKKIRDNFPINYGNWSRHTQFCDYYFKKAVKAIVHDLMDIHIPFSPAV